MAFFSQENEKTTHRMGVVFANPVPRKDLASRIYITSPPFSPVSFSETPVRQISEFLTLVSISLHFFFMFSNYIALSALLWTFSCILVDSIYFLFLKHLWMRWVPPESSICKRLERGSRQGHIWGYFFMKQCVWVYITLTFPHDQHCKNAYNTESWSSLVV